MPESMAARPVGAPAPAPSSPSSPEAGAAPRRNLTLVPGDGVDTGAARAAARVVTAPAQAPGAALAPPRSRRKLADPAPASRTQSIDTIRQREPVAGSALFVDGVGPRDVVQGYSGTCWFVASMASLAQMRPEVIRDLIRDNGDGTYTVRFHGDGGRRTEVTVDDDLATFGPRLRNRVVNTRGADPKELWPAILEKAYAQLYGSYGRIEGWYPAEAMRVLAGTGGDGLTTWSSADELFSAVQRGERGRRAMAATTSMFASEAGGLARFHVYSVLGATVEGGRRYVILRDPRAVEYRSAAYDTDVAFQGGRSRQDGIFRMTIEEFRERFSALTVEKP